MFVAIIITVVVVIAVVFSHSTSLSDDITLPFEFLSTDVMHFAGGDDDKEE